jgi:transglutaminase-like putative cysteine protease
MVVRSPVRIPARSLHAKLRYLVTRADGQPPQLPTTSEQGVVADGARSVVSVCSNCGQPEQPTSQELARYLAANAWVRSDAPEIRQLARSAVSSAQRTDLRMRALVRATIQRMRGTSDFLGYADAVQALRSGSGDCTEFAVLLAALARAQGIPARVVAGLAYSSRFSGKKDVFSPHTWVQAWDGQSWKSYDAALGEFDSTHIALGTGDGSPDELNAMAQQLRLLRIEKAAVVRDP